MFDKLVESTKQNTGRRAGRYFALTTVVYALALVVIGVGTIVTFSPVIAEEYNLMTTLIPPPLGKQVEIPRPQQPNLKAQPDSGFVAPKKIIDILPADQVKSREVPIVERQYGASYLIGKDGGGPGAKWIDESTPPPPAPKPRPTPDPTPSPAPERRPTTKVSEGVLQGIAIQKFTPTYPQIARAAKSSGQVQVQITISEEGRVIEATVLTGPVLLRSAALEAARRWVFSPTKLSNVPVKVQGVLTFNFILE